ncbi:MAG: ABC transporter permease subunit [Candidatus Promineifilaceae bacterium]|nr:ABC transporter permease subunit [Candidatus Promineifilaceae bacterium]
MDTVYTITTLARRELREARRGRWFWLFTAAFAALALALAWFGATGLGLQGLSGFRRTGASLVNVILLIIPLMGLALGALSLAGERERGTLLYLLAQPIGRMELIAGKFIGLLLAMLTTLVLGFGLSGLIIAWQGGAMQAGDYVSLVALSVLLSAVSLSLGLLISALSGKTTTAVGVALFLWLLLVFFGDLGLMGTALVLRLQISELFTLALANPLQLFKMAAILLIRGDLEVLGPAGVYAIRTYGAGLLPVLLTLLLAWLVLPLNLTYLAFRKRGAL